METKKPFLRIIMHSINVDLMVIHNLQLNIY